MKRISKAKRAMFKKRLPAFRSMSKLHARRRRGIQSYRPYGDRTSDGRIPPDCETSVKESNEGQ